MKKTIILILSVSLLMNSASIFADDSAEQGARVSLGLTDSEKTQFLGEMRKMLASIQGIITGIGENDRQMIIQSARNSGNRMARATPESIRRKLPQSFKEIGGPTHMMFEELVVRAETDEMDTLAILTGKIMQQCMACHEIFTVQ
jgi:cytochrome c556